MADVETRPTRASCRKAMLTSLVPPVLEWCAGRVSFDADRVERDLDRAFGIEIAPDGYRIAQRLDVLCAWTPNSHLVDILDRCRDFWSTAHEEAQRLWVERTGLKLDFGIGDEVQTKHGAGIVADLREETGHYIVAIREDQRAATKRGLPAGFVLAAEDVAGAMEAVHG